jgi:putative ABC transport system substrate-binding protein
LPAAWRRAARARDRVRKIGVIMNYGAADPEGKARLSALQEELGKLGWAAGRNVQIEIRWAAGNAELMATSASQLISQLADVIVANSTPLLTVLDKNAPPPRSVPSAPAIGSSAFRQ